MSDPYMTRYSQRYDHYSSPPGKLTERLMKLSQPYKKSQKYTQSVSLMTMSRLYDNHFDSDMHEKPWISLGIFKTDKMVKYEHSDAGLSFHNIKIKKLRTFQELWEKNQDIEEKKSNHQGFRHFREFMDIQEEDVVVTIEYCTNCHEHMGSTKHDEQRYLQTAIKLKNEIIQKFPICKVILKPLIYDQFDHSIDTMFLQRRLGCLEVQVMAKQRGVTKKAVVYSKLSTKEWPQFPQVINKLPAYFKKVSFTLELKFADSDQKLPNVDLKIQPYRPYTQTKLISQSQSMVVTQERGNNHLLRPQSTSYTRPKSAYSNISAQSQRSLKVKQTTGEQQEEYYRIERTNQDGKIILRDVPLDIYEVIIEESNDFMSENKKINLFELADKNLPLDQVLHLRKQTHSFICISVYAEPQRVEIKRPQSAISSNQTGNQTEDIVKIPVTEAKVELVPLKGGKEAVLKESPAGSGKYEIVVEPGVFKILVKKVDHQVLQQQIHTKSGVCCYNFEIKRCKPEDGYDPVADALDKKLSIKPSSDLFVKKPKFLNPPSGESQKIELLQFRFIDLVHKKPVQDVYIRLFDEQHNKLYSYRSNEDGICKALLKHKIIRGKITIEHSEYYHQTKVINEQYPLTTNKGNVYHIIKKPYQGQVIVLLVNQINRQFNNLYVLQEDRQVIQADPDIEQYQNPTDGIQYIKFDNLSTKKDILQLFACLPSLKHVETIQEIYVLTPTTIERQQLPEIPVESSNAPYFWILGSLKEPYESFDVVNSIIESPLLKNYPNLVKNREDIVVQCAFQPPNLVMAANKNRSISVWNLDNYCVDSVVPNGTNDICVSITVWDDDNVLFLDQSGYISWLRKDDQSQNYYIGYQLNTGRKTRSIAKVGSDTLIVGCIDGGLILIAVKLDINSVVLNIDCIIEHPDQINKLITVTNDSVAVLCDIAKTLNLFKVEKSLDRPLSATLIKSIALKGYVSGGDPILQILSLESRYLILGGLDGVLVNVSIDTLEKCNSLCFSSDNNTTSVQQHEDGVLIVSDDHVTAVYAPENLMEMKTHIARKFVSPVPLYKGEVVCYEKRLVTFSETGSMLVWSLSKNAFPNLSQFLKKSEFPRQLQPQNDECYLLIQSNLPASNIGLYLINENGEIYKNNVEGIVEFVDNRIDGYFYAVINTQNQQGLWRIALQLQNTELIKHQVPAISFIYRNGYQTLNLPHQLPQSRKQTYHWLVGTLIPGVETLKTTNLYTDQQIVGRFPSLEMQRHQGKINALQILNKDEFVTAGEDRNVIIWDINKFTVNKILQHESEILSILLYNGAIVTGSKEGQVVIWKLNDSTWVQELKFKHHEKGIYSICYLDGSLITASEDRKIHVVNYLTGVLEYSETVDRTFVISVSPYAKDQFAAGFPDGRVKTYKREKNGPKVILKTLRTTVTVKVQHLYLMPGNILFVGGVDKISDVVNIDAGTKLKTLKDGHQGAVTCSIPYSRYLISGGTDGRLNVWHLDRGVTVKTIELQKEEIRGIMILNKVLVTASSSGALRFWQEVCPMIDTFVDDDIE